MIEEEKPKKTPEQLKTENNMNFAKKMTSEGMSSLDELAKAIRSKQKLSLDNIMSYLQKPTENATYLQQELEFMRLSNGTLREIMAYKSNILTYDHYLVVNDISKYKSKDKLDKAYKNACEELERYNIKTLCRWLIEEQIRKGEVYIYKQEGVNITFFKIPNELCKITHMDGFIQGFSIKLNGITEKTLGAYPKDIQKLWKRYKAGGLSNDKNFKDNYYKIDISKGVALSIDIMETKGVPYYSSLLKDLARLDDLMDLENESAYADNFKILHQMLPSDKDGNLLVDYETAYQYHQAVKSVLCEGIEVVTTPYEINSITLQNNQSKNFDYLTKLKNNLYDSAGVDASLFNSNNRSTAQGVLYSARVDTVLATNLLDKLKIWLNYDFQFNSKLKNFRICFCDSTIYDKDAKVAAAVGFTATWFSKLELQALMGRTPLEAYNLLRMEDLMGDNEYMLPLMNSHTMSGSDIEDNGRPDKAEETNDPNAAPTTGEN